MCGINYKCVFGEGSLSAIQLDFKNAPPTPWIKTEMSEEDAVNRIEVDPRRKIRKIAMKLLDGFDIHGIRLTDDKGRVFVEKEWCKHGTENAKWITRDIPEGMEMIGLQAFTGYDKFCRIGWLFWIPKINDKNMYRKPKRKKIVMTVTPAERKQ